MAGVVGLRDDPLAQLEAEGRAQKQASARQRRVEKRAGERRVAVVGGRRSKRAGYRAEKLVEGILAAYGWTRVPMSGALGGSLSGDLRRDMAHGDARPDKRALNLCEVKRRAGQQAQLRRWVSQGGADFCVIDTGQGAEPLVVLLMGAFTRVLDEAGYRNAQQGPCEPATAIGTQDTPRQT